MDKPLHGFISVISGDCVGKSLALDFESDIDSPPESPPKVLINVPVAKR